MAGLRHPWQTTIVLTCPIPCPYWRMATRDNKNRLEYTLFSLSAMPKWKINRNLTLSEKVSYVLNNVTERSFIPDEGVPTFTESGDDMTANRSSLFQ